MCNTAKFTLLQVELEFDKVEERHHNQLKLKNEVYQNSAEMKANIAVMDIMGVATLELRKVLAEYKKSQ
jgi:hypothetical protein